MSKRLISLAVAQLKVSISFSNCSFAKFFIFPADSVSLVDSRSHSWGNDVADLGDFRKSKCSKFSSIFVNSFLFHFRI